MRDTLGILKSAEAWLSRWAVHVGSCKGGMACECGLTFVRWETAGEIERLEDIKYGDEPTHTPEEATK